LKGIKLTARTTKTFDSSARNNNEQLRIGGQIKKIYTAGSDYLTEITGLDPKAICTENRKRSVSKR
jgi:hypothetical protein